ncbi:MAG: hypothetical protein A2V67_15800 [Deltaproteobacteria bacterium RBG_13_61_14]|nr:MAG: hypothetical protein A2V67_15800 [Deltaproteobacteria bacterium RBG_13_61_14]
MEKALGSLQPIDIREFWDDEAREFTPWLAKPKNLERLSSTLGMELELEGVEVPVGPYKADIVAQDISSNSRVIIENQLDDTDHGHLGKLITYASGLDAKIIIWISRNFTDEHRRAIDFLNENSAPNLRFWGLAIKLFRIGDSMPAPMFEIVASPNDYLASVKVDDKVPSETKALYLKFWTAFKDICSSQGTLLSLRKPKAQHWFSMAVGRGKFSLSLTASVQKKRVGCEIYMRGKNAKTAFKLLEKDRKTVEAVTGPLDWQELPDGQDCRIFLAHPDADISNQANWPKEFEWLKEKAELFHKVFSPIIKRLPIMEADAEEEANSEKEET